MRGLEPICVCVSVVAKGRGGVNSNGGVCVFPWTKGQMGRSVVNSCVFVVSKRRSVVHDIVFHVFAWSKGGKVVNNNGFVCFCMAEGRTCRKVSCFCVFLLGRTGEVSNKIRVFVWFLGKVEKCRVFVCFLVFVCFYSVEQGKCQKVSCFCVFSW